MTDLPNPVWAKVLRLDDEGLVYHPRTLDVRGSTLHVHRIADDNYGQYRSDQKWAHVQSLPSI